MKSLLLVLGLFPIMALGQGQNDTWIFGFNCGLDVSNEQPIPLSGAITNTLGGTACVSDEDGALLFYASGIEARDRNYELMPNGAGLAGCDGSAQGALIVPFPEDNTRYYLFTNAAHYEDTPIMYPGVTYSVVDMTLNNGLGDITLKNVPLRAGLTEKLTATRHANGNDVWVVMHGYGNAEYYAYLVTCAGIGGPVVSNVGRVMDDPWPGIAEDGWMQFSPQGDRLAATWTQRVSEAPFDCEGRLDVLDFDNYTGDLSNVISDTYSGGSFQSKGVCFSASGQRLYRSQLETYGDFDQPPWDVTAYVYQYDLTSPDPMNTEQVVAAHTLDDYNYTAMQRTPSGKILVGRVNGQAYAIIRQPDVLGDACDFDEFGGAFFWPSISYESMPNVWDMHPTVLPLDTVALQDSVSWCGPEDFTLGVNYPFPPDNVSYLWGNGATTTTTPITEGGTYTVVITLPCVTYFDTIVAEHTECPEGPVAEEPFTDPTMPNVFSPDMNGTNDGFRAIGHVAREGFELQVFDRWGLLMFSATDPSVYWKGSMMKGGHAPEGVYFWSLRYLHGTEAVARSGHVTLLR